ncbi:iron-sulfur cluster insertion protein ErpA [Pyruvatibacter sp.]|uniref:iron-sulfur cluster insertion protein ErpA n=1 Tax=Pyruvatibacter sp. TaxID=1981328 RepID=UPI0032EE3B47
MSGVEVESRPADTAPFAVTANAAKQVAAILSGEPAGTMLRVSVDGGGCSGFQYNFTLETSKNADDLVIERDGATVLVDEMSLEYMSGSELDYVDDLIGQSFQVKNPNATASCGCGTSFSV